MDFSLQNDVEIFVILELGGNTLPETNIAPKTTRMTRWLRENGATELSTKMKLAF